MTAEDHSLLEEAFKNPELAKAWVKSDQKATEDIRRSLKQRLEAPGTMTAVAAWEAAERQSHHFIMPDEISLASQRLRETDPAAFVELLSAAKDPLAVLWLAPHLSQPDATRVADFWLRSKCSAQLAALGVARAMRLLAGAFRKLVDFTNAAPRDGEAELQVVLAALDSRPESERLDLQLQALAIAPRLVDWQRPEQLSPLLRLFAKAVAERIAGVASLRGAPPALPQWCANMPAPVVASVFALAATDTPEPARSILLQQFRLDVERRVVGPDGIPHSLAEDELLYLHGCAFAVLDDPTWWRERLDALLARSSRWIEFGLPQARAAAWMLWMGAFAAVLGVGPAASEVAARVVATGADFLPDLTWEFSTDALIGPLAAEIAVKCRKVVPTLVDDRLGDLLEATRQADWLRQLTDESLLGSGGAQRATQRLEAVRAFDSALEPNPA